MFFLYTIVETGGKQYKMAVGDILDVELLGTEPGKNFILDKILLFSGNGEVKIGTPYLEGAQVNVAVQDQFKDEKIIVFKYKNKTGYRRKKGHRQNLQRIKVAGIEIPGVEKIGEVPAEKAEAKPKRTVRKKTASQKETKKEK